MTSTIHPTSHISVIIPTLNEAENLGRQLESLSVFQELEIIVADGGSTDQTLDIASEYGVKVLQTPAGRGLQQNEGARSASRENLVFLHCDTGLPHNFPDLVVTALAQPGIATGAFRLHIDAAGIGYRLVEWGSNFRSCYIGLPYGDQGLFLRKNVLEKVGGFPDQLLLEDLQLVRRLRKIGRIHIVPAAATTSARRWKKLGLIRTTLVNQLILIGYLCGIKPEQLAGIYRRGTLLKRG